MSDSMQKDVIEKYGDTTKNEVLTKSWDEMQQDVRFCDISVCNQSILF